MTTPRVVLSPSARADLLEIETFIAENSNEHRAEAVIGRLVATLRTLSFRPGLGRSRSYTERGELAFPVERWMVIYEPLPDLEGIRVLRVIDGRRDLENLLA